MESENPPDFQDGHENLLSFNLVPTIDEDSCPFWVGGFAEGKLLPSQLYDLSSRDVFIEAAQKGLCEDQPLMISDYEKPRGRYFFLVPFSQKRDQHTIAQEFLTVHDSWTPRKLGVFLAPSLFKTKSELNQALLEILCVLTSRNTLGELRLLVPSGDLNELLDLALEFKSHFYTGKRRLILYHF